MRRHSSSISPTRLHPPSEHFLLHPFSTLSSNTTLNSLPCVRRLDQRNLRAWRTLALRISSRWFAAEPSFPVPLPPFLSRKAGARSILENRGLRVSATQVASSSHFVDGSCWSANSICTAGTSDSRDCAENGTAFVVFAARILVASGSAACTPRKPGLAPHPGRQHSCASTPPTPIHLRLGHAK
jgi:hypothetical protein